MRDLAGGFSPGATAVLEWPDRAVFVKAVGAELNPDSPELHRREAVVSAALPRVAPQFPRLLDVYDDGDWVALAFDAVDGRPPRHPWDAASCAAVVGALAALHDALTPSPAPRARAAGRLAAPALRRLGRAGRHGRAAAGLDPWSGRHLDRLAELESGWPDGVRRADAAARRRARRQPARRAADGVVFVDWPHAACRRAGLRPGGLGALGRAGGRARLPRTCWPCHEPSRRVDPDASTVLVAAFGGFFVRHSLRPPPPGLPTLRPFQAAQGAVALAWLRRRTGW